jgi:hypothetical protein
MDTVRAKLIEMHDVPLSCAARRRRQDSDRLCTERRHWQISIIADTINRGEAFLENAEDAGQRNTTLLKRRIESGGKTDAQE